MKKLKNYVNEISFEDKLEMIENWKEFNEKGSIGNCLLRKYVEEFDNKGSFFLITQNVMMFVFEEFAMKYLEDRKPYKDVEQRFFDFLFYNDVYGKYFDKLSKESEKWDFFKELYKPSGWFVNAFFWGDEYEKWEILDEKWNELLKG